jgi:hypothetical protein
MKGTVVSISRKHFPALDDNEFYWVDLIGSAVENLQGEQLGVVSDMMDNGAHPILVVKAPVQETAPSPKTLPMQSRGRAPGRNPRLRPNADSVCRPVRQDGAAEERRSSSTGARITDLQGQFFFPARW